MSCHSADRVQIETCLGRGLAGTESISCSEVAAGSTAYCNLKSQSLFQSLMSRSYDQEIIEISRVAGTAKAVDSSGGDFLTGGRVSLTRAQLNSLSCVYVQMVTLASAQVGKNFYIQLNNTSSGKQEQIPITVTAPR